MGTFGEMTSPGWVFHPTSMSDSEINNLFNIVFIKQLQTFFYTALIWFNQFFTCMRLMGFIF